MAGMGKVLLIHPEISRTKYNFAGAIENEPLEIEYLQAVLEDEGYQVEVFDKAVERQSVQGKLRAFMPDCVYVCGRTRQENYMKEYCLAAKEANPNAITIVGGIHAQHATQRLFAPGVDYILPSFNIFRVADILRYHREGAPLPEAIGDICYKKEGEWVQNPQEPFDINRLPRPNRSYFYAHLQNYRYLELLPCAHVRTAYSCPYNCQFCYRNRLNCGQYVARSIQDVVNEIEGIGVPNIYIIDDDFLVSRQRVETFIALIKQKNIQKQYVCYGRADFIVKNEDLMRRLKEIGFYYVLVGLEAIDDARLDSYNKKAHLNQNIECIRIMNEIGINIMGMFILDLDFTKKDFKNLYRWMGQHNLRHVAVSIFAPEFGLETYDMYKDRLITDNPEHWDYLHLVAKPGNLSVNGFYFQYYKLMIRLFLRSRRQGVYDFIDYGAYIRSILKNIFKPGEHDG